MHHVRHGRGAGQLGGGRARLTRVIDILQTLARRQEIAELTTGYGLVTADECHHVPAAAFEHAVRQIPARCWLGITATPYRRDKLDDLIALQIGPVRHTITTVSDMTKPAETTTPQLPQPPGEPGSPPPRPAPVLHVHPTDGLGQPCTRP